LLLAFVAIFLQIVIIVEQFRRDRWLVRESIIVTWYPMNAKRQVVYVWALCIPNGTLLEAQGTIERMIQEGGKAQGKLSSSLLLLSLLFPTFLRIGQIVFGVVVAVAVAGLE
jgi:hypothetical protein